MSMVRKASDLYGLPLDEFVKARDTLAKELRKAGKTEAADEVKALRKPSVSAWTVNQLARRYPQELKALVKTGDVSDEALRALLAVTARVVAVVARITAVRAAAAEAGATGQRQAGQECQRHAPASERIGTDHGRLLGCG